VQINDAVVRCNTLAGWGQPLYTEVADILRRLPPLGTYPPMGAAASSSSSAASSSSSAVKYHDATAILPWFVESSAMGQSTTASAVQTRNVRATVVGGLVLAVHDAVTKMQMPTPAELLSTFGHLLAGYDGDGNDSLFDGDVAGGMDDGGMDGGGAGAGSGGRGGSSYGGASGYRKRARDDEEEDYDDRS
jgi:hypothetical protein